VQASGRLLRTESDRGRVTLLDRRIVTRRYGQAMLASLPPFKQFVA
jgi:ATP-dependent DNA helicase DinG